MTSSTTSPDFFEAMYRANPDPWNFAHDAYENQRYAATLAALPPRRFRRAFEPGCSVGVLTRQLAPLCDHVDAIDISETAVEQARQRCAAFPNVYIEHQSLPDAQPSPETDLLVLSEIGYYFPIEELRRLARKLTQHLPSGATVLAVHWLGHSSDHLLTGDQVHEILIATPHLQLDHSERHEHFRLDRFLRL